MSVWAEVCLGIIAFAMLVTATIQIAVLVAGARAVKRVNGLIDRVEHRLEPTFIRVETIGEELSRVASLAVLHTARIGVALDHFLQRADRTADKLQAVVAAPVTESAALLAGARAVLSRLKRGLGQS